MKNPHFDLPPNVQQEQQAEAAPSQETSHHKIPLSDSSCLKRITTLLLFLF